MKNILGTKADLELFDKQGKRVYEYCKISNNYSFECTYDLNGNKLTHNCSNGNSCESTYDSSGNELTYKNSDGFSCECTYDSKGNELTYKDSDGVTRGFSIPEYTMEELVAKLGNFKIKTTQKTITDY